MEELQKISILLRSRQVENLNLDADSTNAFFVTSGNNQEFVDQMQQLVTVDNPTARTFNPGRLLLIIWRLLAKIRVDGRIQQRADKSIEIWVQINYGNSVSAVVNQVIMPETAIDIIDEVLVRPIARELALRLFLELGQISHLGSTTRSLAHFLRGLEASARKD